MNRRIIVVGGIIFAFMVLFYVSLAYSSGKGGYVRCYTYGACEDGISVPDYRGSVSCGWFGSCGHNEFCCRKDWAPDECYPLDSKEYYDYVSCPWYCPYGGGGSDEWVIGNVHCYDCWENPYYQGTPCIKCPYSHETCYCSPSTACYLKYNGKYYKYKNMELYGYGFSYPYDRRCRGDVEYLGSIDPKIVDSGEFCESYSERWKYYKYRQLVIWNEERCDYSTYTWSEDYFIEDCSDYNRWVTKDLVWKCDGSYKRCLYKEEEYHDYACHEWNKRTWCDYTTPYTRETPIKCENSWTYWKGGGDRSGLNDPPSYEYEKYCSNGNWKDRKTGRSKDCDYLDKRNICRGNNLYDKDYYVKRNTNECTYHWILEKDCTWCSDNDGGLKYDKKGVVKTGEGCSGGSCIENTYVDYCDSNGNLVEFYCSGEQKKSTVVRPGNGVECDDGALYNFVNLKVNMDKVDITPGEFVTISFEVENLRNENKMFDVSVDLESDGEKAPIENVFVNGKKSQLGKISFGSKEKKDYVVKFFVPDTWSMNKDVVLNIEVVSDNKGKYVYRKVFNAVKSFVNISIALSLKDFQGHVLKNQDVRVCVCDGDVDYCDESTAIECWKGKSDKNGYVIQKFKALIGIGKYKLAVIPIGENGYAETEFEIKEEDVK